MTNSNSSASQLPFATLYPFDLTELKANKPDGPRDERLRFFVPGHLVYVLDEIRFASGHETNLTDVALYALRLGQARLDHLKSLSKIDQDYSLLLAWRQASLVGQLPAWSFSLKESRHRLTLRYIRPVDTAWATRRVLPVGLNKSELHQMCLVAGIVDGPVHPSVKEMLTRHLWHLESYLNVRASFVAECVEQAGKKPGS